MKLVVFIQVALLFVQLVSSGHVENESPVSCESTLERCINTDCLGNNTVLEEIKQELCDIQDTECTDNPCKNGGTCINVTDTPVCQCPPEFVGKDCELNCTVDYETEPGLFDIEFLLITPFTEGYSKEECDSSCTVGCTFSTFIDPFCTNFKAPVFSVTSVSVESKEEECKSICTSQTNSCRSFQVLKFSEVFCECYTYTVSATDLPVLSTGSNADIFNKITKCDLSP